MRERDEERQIMSEQGVGRDLVKGRSRKQEERIKRFRVSGGRRG